MQNTSVTPTTDLTATPKRAHNNGASALINANAPLVGFNFWGQLVLESRQIRWRLAFTYALVIFLIMAGLGLYLITGLGLTAAAIWLPLLVSTLLITALLAYQAEQAAATIRRLTSVAERITAGDLNARILSMSSGEVGQLARAFNRMADRLQDQISKRKRQKDRLDTILNVMSDGVLMVNRLGNVRLVNPAAAAILQTTRERMLERSYVQVVRDHRIIEVFARCQVSDQEENAVFELASGCFVQVAVTPFLKGEDRGHLILLHDLTQLHQLQTVRQDFVSNVSHELRTPLASLRALVETLNDGALDDPPAARRFLQRMEVEVDALTQMVQELLELSRIEAGNAPLNLHSAPVSEVIGQAAERLRPQAERARVNLLIDLPAELPNLQVDITRAHQVVINLVHNAIKFTPADGQITVQVQLPGKVGLGTGGEAKFVQISIHDTGEGIAPDDLPRIFERFYKADRARSSGGTGLGLAIAKHIVQAHGGRIWAESVYGQGSTFCFTLPIAPERGKGTAHFQGT